MRVLFLHFSFRNEEVEGRELPRFFASMGHTVHSLFLKDIRKFTAKYNSNGEIDQIGDDEMFDTYDLIVTKSDAYQKYGRRYAGEFTKIVNIIPLGLDRNVSGVHLAFRDDQLIKAPTSVMRDVYCQYVPWHERKDQIIIAASLGTDKNQLEFTRFFDASILPGYKILFLGKSVSNAYVDKLKNELDAKGVEYQFDDVDRKTLAQHYMESKFSALTTDTRPHQPYDPSPRVVFESIAAGTPCMLSDLVCTHEGAKNFSFFYEHGNKESFLDMMKKCADEDKVSRISKESHSYGCVHYTLENACKVAYADIMAIFQ